MPENVNNFEFYSVRQVQGVELMQKLFTLLRQGNIEEITRLISDKPELINSISGPKPKKDHGQSLLQVALKTGHNEIAEFLIDAGINVNFMEAEENDLGPRMPAIFDAITAVIDSLCIGVFRTSEEATRKFEESDAALGLLKKMIQCGADVNGKTSNGLSTVNWSLHHASLIMGRPSIYPNSQEKVREQLRAVLDCLFDNGFDYDAWLEDGYYPEPSPGPCIRELFLGNKEYTANANEEYKQTREFLQSFLANR